VSFWSFIFFTPQQMKKINSFSNHARYRIICTMMHILTVKPCVTPQCICPFYTPAHHMNWLQLLTPTLNITNCHMYMSTVVPADAQCYVTQCHQYTPECLSWTEGLYYFCILPDLSNTSGQKTKKLVFYSRLRNSRFMYNKKCMSFVLLLLLVLLILQLPPPPPSLMLLI